MKPFIFGMIGGAIGAMFGSWMGLGATSYGVTGLPGYLIINKALPYTILLAISGGIAFVLTFFFWHEEVKKTETVAKKAPEEVVITTEKGQILSPVSGRVISASEIPDAAFSGEMMGPSVGIEPDDGIVYAPFDGEVVMVFPTKHAMGLKADEGGMELLIHVGVDTITMNGEGFETFVDSGSKFKKGDKLMSFDRKTIADAGHPDTVIVALTNAADYAEVKKSV